MAKRSRRARRQQIEKQKQKTPGITTPQDTLATVPDAAAASAKMVDLGPSTSRKAVNFAQEYFYVYRELRNIFIIAVLMFVVLVGLSFVI